jgi:hypothetical protein
MAILMDPCQPQDSDDDGDGVSDRGIVSSWWIVTVPMRLGPLPDPLLELNRSGDFPATAMKLAMLRREDPSFLPSFLPHGPWRSGELLGDMR